MLIKKEYTFPDLKEMPLDEAPSLDMPHFIVDKFYMRMRQINGRIASPSGI